MLYNLVLLKQRLVFEIFGKSFYITHELRKKNHYGRMVFTA